MARFFGRLAFLAGLAGALTTAADELPFLHHDTGHPRVPLPSSSVLRIIQDRDGFIWMGFYAAGLLRYDGSTGERYGVDDGLVHGTVRELVQDREGHLWVGCESGVVVSLRPLDAYAPGERIRFADRIGGVDLPHHRIRLGWMAPHPHGGVVVGTPDGRSWHYRVRRDRLASRFLDGPGGTAGETQLAALTTSEDGVIWLALEGGELARRGLDDTAWTSIAADTRPHATVTTLAADGAGGILAGCRDGSVWRWTASTGRFLLIDQSLSEQVADLQMTLEGDLWATSIGNGLRLVSSDRRRSITRRDGLPSDTVWDILLDREGTLWFAHNGGLSKLRSDWRAFSAFTATRFGDGSQALPDPNAFAVLPTQTATIPAGLWVGTSDGVVLLRDDRRVARLSIADGLPSSSVYALAAEHGRRVWLGTLEGLACLTFSGRVPPDATAPPRAVEVDGVPATLTLHGLSTVYQVRIFDHADAGTSVWIAGTHGLSALEAGRWQHFGTADGLPSSGAACLAADDNGTLWVGTKDGGLLHSATPVLPWPADSIPAGLRLEPGAGFGERSPASSIQDVEAAAGAVWAATGVGLYRVDRDPTTAAWVARPAGRSRSPATAVAWDPTRSWLWTTDSDGLHAVDPRNGGVLRSVSSRDGLLDDEVWIGNALAVDPRGFVVVGTPRGVSVYRPGLDTPRPVTPPVRIRSATYDESSGGANRIEVRYAALTFVDEQAVRYRTRLVGLDDDWSEPTSETLFRYTNLPALLFPRTYRFEVIASGPEEAWSPVPATWQIRVSPAWWTRWWAVLSGLVTLTAGLVAADRIRTRRLVARTRQLEAMVDERTARIRRNVDEMRTLDRIVEVVNREVDLDRVMETLLHQGLVLLPRARRGAFLLLDPDSHEFRVTAVSGWERDLPPGDSVPESEARGTFTAGGIRVGDGIYAVRPVTDRSGTTVNRHLEFSETLLTLHLRHEGALEGYLVFELDPQSTTPSDEEIELVQRYRQHALTALDKAHMMRRLAEASDQAATASRAKSRFLATMSHELRTPLNSVIGFSEILLDRSDGSDPRRDRFVRNIHTSGTHLLSLINDVLDLSKIEAGRMELEREAVNVPELVGGVVRIMSGVADRRTIAIDVEVERALPRVVLDGPKVKRVLYNLLSNAVKFSDSGSHVTVAARLLATPSGPLDGFTLELVVTDRGIGIPDSERQRIFDEFYQIDSGPARRFVGTGLGLALVQRYVELHGGRIEVESSPGVGSAFRILLPTELAHTPRPASES